MSTPTTNARALFAAARDDGPESTDRDALFRKIALSTGIAAGTAAGATVLSLVPAASATGVAAVAATATASAGTAATSAAAAAPAAFAFGSKLIALGLALGALTTAVGVIVAVTVGSAEGPVEAQHPAAVAARTANVVAPAAASPGAKLAQPVARKRDTSSATSDTDVDLDTDDENAAESAKVKADAKAKADARAAAAAKANGTSAASTRGGSGAAGDLGEEARLVTAARNALVAGDAARALSLVQATRKLGSRSLEPEELGLEARALRALGRADEAAVAELVLRRRYPDHALAR